MVAEVVKTDCQIVIIGCGGLGMILAGRLKALGKICIVMGGAVQVLFGIKGKRWENHEYISKLWNSEWVYPSPSETPRKALEIERGCYW
jgi:ketopantoate reductase